MIPAPPARSVETPVSSLNEQDMIRHAIDRSLVRTDDGKVWELHGWGSGRHRLPDGKRRGTPVTHARLRSWTGSFVTVPKDRIASVITRPEVE